MRGVRSHAGALTVLLWFAGLTIVAVWNVFHDPTIDHRLLVLGALLPDIVDAPFGGARAGHAVVTSIALLLVTVVSTIGRRGLRRRLLAVPIGSFLHLVLDGVFSSTRVFWWPFTGLSLPSVRLPSVQRPIGLTVAMEAAGLVALAWVWNRFGLDDADQRRHFWRTGRLDPVVPSGGRDQ